MDPFSMMMAANAGLSLLNGINQYQNANGMYGGGTAMPSLMSLPPLGKGILGGGLMAAPDLLGYNDMQHPLGQKSPLNLASPLLMFANLFK